MAIKILELGTLTVLTEEEEESYKGGILPAIVNIVGEAPGAVKTTVNNTTDTTVPLTISGLEDGVNLTTKPVISLLPTT